MKFTNYNKLKEFMNKTESIAVMIAWDLHEQGIVRSEFAKHSHEELNLVSDALKNQIYNAMQDIEKGIDVTPCPIRLAYVDE